MMGSPFACDESGDLLTSVTFALALFARAESTVRMSGYGVKVGDGELVAEAHLIEPESAPATPTTQPG